MKVIFLDVDGVLNYDGTTDRIDGFIGFDPELINNFNKIIEAVPEAKIVISSSWRKPFAFMTAYSDFNGLKKLFADRGLKGEIIGHTPIYWHDKPRGDEIRDWIENYTGTLDRFVILDDDTSGMAGGEYERYEGIDDDGEDSYTLITEMDLRPNHVVTSWSNGGLTMTHVEKAIKILKGE